MNDGSLTSNTATVSISVTPVNDAPTATPQSVSTNQDTAVGITLAGTDIDGDSLSFAVTGGPSNGGLSGTAPNLTYTPTGDYSGSDSFTFTVDDGTAPPAPATVSITVFAVGGGDTGTITGVVTEFGKGKKLSDVTVSPGGQSTTTSRQGTYTLTGVTAGANVDIQASASGYVTDSTTMALADGGTETVNFALAKDTGGGGTGTQPSASITAPIDGTTVSGTVTVQVDASDAEDDAVPLTLNVEVSIDGGATWHNAPSTGGTSYAGNLDSTSVTDGGQTIDARATDSDGNISPVASVNVTVDNGGAPPPTTATTSIVTSIIFDFKGKNLKFTVRVEDNLGNPVAGAGIFGDLYGPGGPDPVSFDAPTKANAEETFIIRAAPTGDYRVDITAIDALPLIWNGITPDNGGTAP